MRKEKIMKSMSFKSREDMIKCLGSLKDNCGMDSLVSKRNNELSEAEYWEMKAEVHFGL